jgi:hypothetical protein
MSLQNPSNGGMGLRLGGDRNRLDCPNSGRLGFTGPRRAGNYGPRKEKPAGPERGSAGNWIVLRAAKPGRSEPDKVHRILATVAVLASRVGRPVRLRRQ